MSSASNDKTIKFVSLPVPTKKRTDISNIPHDIQKQYTNLILLDEDFPHRSFFSGLIQKKLSGYKQQDIKKRRDGTSNISFDETIEKMIASQLTCYYCRRPVFVIYDDVRQEDQWSLERINNDIPHRCENVEIACLKCNLKRRLMCNKQFKDSKQMGFNNVKKV